MLQVVVIDFVDVKHADLSGLIAMKEVQASKHTPLPPTHPSTHPSPC
jgi:hypothetical protein